jgi:outer membrane protein assembly factor BamB
MKLLASVTRLGVIFTCLGFAACGGGGGGGGGGGSSGGGGGGGTGQPTIIATVLTFPTGAVLPGFVPAGDNSGAGVRVTDQNGAAIATATATVNGTPLTYVTADQQYEGALSLAPGATVTFSIVVNGTTYTASHSAFSTFPSITAPAANANWSLMAENLISWTGAVPDNTSQYAVGVFDAGSGALLWPGNGSFLVVPTSQTSTTVPANSLTVGNRVVLVGIVDVQSLAGAASGSGALVGAFSYAPITVSNSNLSLVSVATAPATATVGVGNSLQLSATGTLSDSTTEDVTTRAQWSSSDTTKVAVNSSGQVTGVAPGSATVSASYGGFSGSTVVTVFQPNPSPVPPLTQSVTFQIDYAHSGRVTVGAGPTFPPSAHWSITLNGAISYPIIAGGDIFVTTDVDSAGGNAGGSLYAIRESDGSIAWGPVSLPSTLTIWSAPAFDHNTLFILNGDGVLRSFDPATGTAGWTTQMPGQGYSSPPMAVNGLVYVSGAGYLTAVEERSGGVVWSVGVQGGDHSSPAGSVDGIFVSYPCQVYEFDPISGTTDWHYDGGCGGGGGKTSVYFNNQLFVRDPPNYQIFDAGTGAQVGSFAPSLIPAFSAQTGFFQNFGTLTAIDQSTHNTLWTFTGDGGLITAPIVIDTVVIVGSSSGTVYALDTISGSTVWSGPAGAALVGPDEQNVSTPLTGLGAGDGYLVVPAGTVLSAWRVIP